jgi:hypothetical protein
VRIQDLDDIAPPKADRAMLSRVRDRGRRLRHRRNATRGAVLALIAIGLVAGAVTISGRDIAHRAISVEATTTTRPGPSVVTERDADAGGLHYMIRLTTPTVTPDGVVRVELRVDNHTNHVVGLDSCVLDDIQILSLDNPRLPGKHFPPVCRGVGIGIFAGGSYTYRGQTTAPGRPGRYLVRANPVPGDALPTSLLAPLDLQVTATRTQTSAPPCTDADLRVHGTVAMPAPHVVATHVTFDHGFESLDPPTQTSQPGVTAAQAWQVAKQFGLVTISPLGTYEILLANYSSFEGGGAHNRLVWLVIGHHVPGAPLGGTPIPMLGATTVPSPPCYFSDAVQVIDATTGQSLAGILGDIQAP